MSVEKRVGQGAGFRKTAVAALAALLALAVSACGNGREDLHSWERDPIVPGYSAADIEIGSAFSAVLEVHGEPEEHRRDGGYLYAYYGRTRQGGKIDDPASWILVVTLYDQGNGYLDPDDEVGAVEVSSPYAGRTSGGVGIGSTAGEVEEEFGSCPNVSTSSTEYGELFLYSYADRGVEFLISSLEGVVTVMVTAYGGLRPVEEKSGEGASAEGIFGSHRADPILPGQSAAGIGIGADFRSVREIYGPPDSSGHTTEGLVYATYTGGYGTWKLTVYLEDRDKGKGLDDFDTVVSICLRHPYAGRTPKGVGIGSSQAEVIKEFGTPERQTAGLHQGEQVTVLEYNTKGIVFALRSTTGEVTEIDVNRPLASS
ncbi:hypothetical protein [Candidatus Solincola tengchongensis]|uniref:hypothetical protein n=1 Tax=Candidatus Solincola tengchongensis TaxID=2900693 RepID=UPI00257E2D12|nr:hypothetical protein [Candidatus Solincola tengchongensis]